jgi:hypothetical protein
MPRRLIAIEAVSLVSSGALATTCTQLEAHMNNGNGSALSEQHMDTDLTSAIANSMLRSLRGNQPEPISSRSPAGPPSLAAFATQLDELVSASPELRRAVEETISRSARQMVAFGDASLPSTAEFLDALRAPPITRRGGTSIRGDWWGFQIYVSHDDLNAFLATTAPLVAITATFAAVLWPPAAPFIAAAAAFVAGILTLLKTLDRGNGVYISMSWFAAGVFVPTTA